MRQDITLKAEKGILTQDWIERSLCLQSQHRDSHLKHKTNRMVLVLVQVAYTSTEQ